MKTMLIDAICGVGFPSPILGLECEKAGLATYDGVNHAWRRSALEVTDEADLAELYDGLRQARDKQQALVSEGVIHAH